MGKTFKPFSGYSKSQNTTNSNSTIATIWIDRSTGWICLKTPFHEKYLEEFRSQFNKDEKRWDSENKIWKVSSYLLDQVIALCEKYFTVDILPEISVKNTGNEDNHSKLIKHLSEEGIKKVWKIVALELHPDVISGDKDKFIEAQQAYEVIIKEMK